MPAAGTQLQCATVPVGGSATYQIWFRLPVPNPNHILTVKVTIMWVGVIGWARLIGLWLVKTSHVNLFLISGLTMHNSVGLGLEHQVLVLVSVLKKKSCSFQDFCCNSWWQWARHTMAFCESLCHNPVIKKCSERHKPARWLFTTWSYILVLPPSDSNYSTRCRKSPIPQR